MEKSKASRALRNALKRRTRKWRQRQVGWFYLGNLLFLIAAAIDPNRFHSFWWASFPVLASFSLGAQWKRSQQGVVRGLDDMAQAEHGVNFDQLSEADQKEMLGRKYLLFGRRLGGFTDERQDTAQRQSADAASHIFRAVLPVLAAICWAIYLWAPPGRLRDALTNAPVLVSWLAWWVVTLPPVIEMWNEPDEPGDLRPV